MTSPDKPHRTPNPKKTRDGKPSKTPKHAARYVAAHGVRAVLCDGTPLDIALSEQALFAQMERRDRAFARIIAATVFRRIGQIDKILAPFIKKRPTDYALAVLRTGAAQILFLDTPSYAAVNGSVALLRRSKKTAHMAGMVNAVLRRVGEQGADLLAKTTTLDNIPNWVLTTWQTSYGEQAAQAMADMFIQEPPLDITIKTSAENPFLNLPSEAENTSEDEIQEPVIKPEMLLGGSVRLAKAGDVRALPGYEAGNWWVQDVSAALPVRVLEAVLKAQGTTLKGKYVLDMCAAPGGKTLQLAGAGAVVTALDKNPVRLERVTENLQRTNLSAHIVAEDAAKWRGANRPDGQGAVQADLIALS